MLGVFGPGLVSLAEQCNRRDAIEHERAARCGDGFGNALRSEGFARAASHDHFSTRIVFVVRLGFFDDFSLIIAEFFRFDVDIFSLGNGVPIDI